MHPRAAWVLVPQPAEQDQELGALGRVECGAQRFLHADGDPEGLVEHAATARGEGERVSAAVGGVRAPLHQPEVLEIVHEGDHAVGVEVEQLADGPLGLALADRKSPEQAEVVRFDARQREPSASSRPTSKPSPETRNATLRGAAVVSLAALTRSSGIDCSLSQASKIPD